LIHLRNEIKNGSTQMDKIKVKNAYPNFRKENSGQAGAINFYTQKTHNFTLTDSTFNRTASRI
jgi:hypothetical protein